MIKGSLRVVLFLVGSLLLAIGLGGAILGVTGGYNVQIWPPFVFAFLVGTVGVIASMFDARSSGYTWCGMLTGVAYIFLGLGYSCIVALQGLQVAGWWPFVVSTIVGLLIFVWGLVTEIQCVEHYK